MARLTARTRSKLPSRDFALPGRRYPIPDRAHAIAAKQRATQMYRKGKLSASQRATIDRKANRVLRREHRRR